MPTPYAPGHFVWHELMTTDREGAISFYSKLFGWTTTDRDMGNAVIYTMINSGDDGIGGMMDLPEKVQAPPHWGVYLSVPDVDAACEKIKTLGGSVVMPPFDLPGTGRAAVVTDPAGAHFYVFAAAESYNMPDTRPGLVGWNELMSTDVDKATAFYEELLSWSKEGRDMGDQGTYWIMKDGDRMAAGAVQMPPGMEAPSYWLSYVVVESIPDTVKKVEALGGAIHVPPTKVEEMNVHFAVIASPDGAAIGIVE